MPIASLDTGVDLFYEWHGEDHHELPVVFIRGTGADSSRWLPQVEAYKKEYRCLIFDNRGSGRSSAPTGPYSVPMMAGDVLALFDALGIRKAHLSGLSLGGAIALDIAIRRPEAVATLQVHGAWARTYGYAALYLGMLKRLLETGGLDLYYDGALLYLFPSDFFIQEHEQAVKILASMKENSSPYEGLLGQLDANLNHDVLDRLHRISVPTLVTVGELDMCLPPHYSQELYEGIRDSDLIVFEGGSHLFGLQDPEAFNDQTLGWLHDAIRRLPQDPSSVEPSGYE